MSQRFTYFQEDKASNRLEVGMGALAWVFFTQTFLIDLGGVVFFHLCEVFGGVTARFSKGKEEGWKGGEIISRSLESEISSSESSSAQLFPLIV